MRGPGDGANAPRAERIGHGPPYRWSRVRPPTTAKRRGSRPSASLQVILH